MAEQTGEHCWLCNQVSDIAHFTAVLDVPGSRTLGWDWNGATKYLRPRCGAQTDLAQDAYLVALHIPAAYVHCKRLGCRSSGPGTPVSAGPAPRWAKLLREQSGYGNGPTAPDGISSQMLFGAQFFFCTPVSLAAFYGRVRPPDPVCLSTGISVATD